ncbi:hypothetical protein NQ853_01735 [Acinetobacter baumannii]|nr:hypothetical protein [Acinetobacter baumannii]
MTDLNKLRSEFESDFAEHLIERDANGFYINDEIQNYWEKHLLKVQIKELKAELEKAKAQAVPETHLLIPKDKVRDLVAELEMAFEANLHLTISDLLPLQQDLKVILETSESGAEG